MACTTGERSGEILDEDAEEAFQVKRNHLEGIWHRDVGVFALDWVGAF